MPTSENHGSFLIHIPREENVIVLLYERASQNKTQPGEAWVRLQTTGDPPTSGEKVFHLDTNLQILEIIERWEGVETARRVVDLSETVH